MASLNAIIVNPDGSWSHTVIENDLRAFQAAVGGGIEAIYGADFTVYVNEDGWSLHLPYNQSVTDFVDRFTTTWNRGILGTALIVGPCDGEESDTHVHENVVNYYMQEH